jgi:para-aminobenzoate synthetase component I
MHYLCAMSKMKDFRSEMNKLGQQGVPFLFIIDFLSLEPYVIPLKDISTVEILFQIDEIRNFECSKNDQDEEIIFSAVPVSKGRYQKAFQKVMQHLQRGDSYLLNLTMPVKLNTNQSLEQLFHQSSARYKLWFKDRFVVFSPETFVRIDENRIIHAHPMKGTIDATIPEAAQKLLNDEKELAEHYTIVDLLRNDLSMVAEKVRVDRFRYIEEIRSKAGRILQTSSHISGKLPSDYADRIGDIITKLLPAGSISGAPKKKTVEIILEAEGYERGFYTGIFGVFDGVSLNSAVMIRFVEQTPDGLIFKAGGGITVNSKCEDEYAELMQKVYLPVKQNNT